MAEVTFSPPRSPQTPPEWAIERWVKAVGVLPRFLGRKLDVLAGLPGIGVVVRFFSSVPLGITWLGLLGVYIAIGSGLPDLRAKMEMTDLQFFDAWPMQVILGLLAVTLTVVTLRRIPLTLYKLGVWMVHIGILTLIGGSVWYFSHKQEGSVRIFLGQTVGSYFDATERALYAFAIDDKGAVQSANSTMTPLPTLPIFYEHLDSLKNPVDIGLPAGTLGDVNPKLKGTGLRVVGYYPYAEMETSWEVDPTAVADANGESPNPAVRVSLALEGVTSGQWLVGKKPSDRALDGPGAPFGTEYLYHPSAERVADLETEFSGAIGITVRVPKLHVVKSYTVEPGQVVAVEGTPYTLTIGEQTEMPLISKGYEGAMSNSLLVAVSRKDAGEEFKFKRMALARYPERSPDFVMGPEGKEKRVQDRVDNDIEIGFQDMERPQIWIVDQLDRPMEMIYRHAGGSVETKTVEVGKSMVVQVATVPMTVTVLERANGVIGNAVPRVIPVEFRERGQTAMDAMQRSVVELELSNGSWTHRGIFVPFVQFAEVTGLAAENAESRGPTVVNIPGVGKVGFVLSTTRRELPSDVKLKDFVAKKYAGATNSYEDFVSTLEVKDKGDGAERVLVPHLNEPEHDHGLTYFQVAWDGDDNAPAGKRFSVIGVANRPGIDVMLLGAVLMVLGIGYAFYVKPMLLQGKKEWLARWAAGRAT